MRILYLIRGLPGSGKTTLARKLCPQRNFCSDEFFEKNGKYIYGVNLQQAAHVDCLKRVAEAILSGEDLAVHNTFSQPWEAESYFELAKEHDYTVIVIECQNKFQNVHGVSQRVIDNMRCRWLPLI